MTMCQVQNKTLSDAKHDCDSYLLLSLNNSGQIFIGYIFFNVEEGRPGYNVYCIALVIWVL